MVGMMKQPDDITFEIRDSIGIITLNHPPENYLAVPGFIPFSLFNEWMSDLTRKCLIIHGKGKNFSAGGNLARIFAAGSNVPVLHQMMDEGVKLLDGIQNLDIPVIAAINRICFGGGLEIALACHIRVASENSLLAFPEVNQNLMPGMGGTYRLPETIGFYQSVRMILGGDMINATDAKEMGLVDHIAPRDQALDGAWNLMHKMTRDRPVKVIRSVMKAIRNSRVLGREDVMKEETRLFCDLASDEAKRIKIE